MAFSLEFGAMVPNASNATVPDAINNTLASGITRTTLPTQVAGVLGLAGIAAVPTLGANGEGDFFLTTAGGLNQIGQGSTSDWTLLNKSGATVASVPTGGTSIALPSITLGSVLFADTGGLVSQDNATFFWDNTSDRLGIGTAIPSTQLHLATSTNNSYGILVEDTGAASGNIAVLELRGNRNDANGTAPFAGAIYLSHVRTDAAVASAEQIGMLTFGGNYTAGDVATITYPASVGAVADGAFVSSANAPTALVFHTGIVGRTKGEVNVSFGTERMRIDSSGDVGIGTNAPTSLLSVGPSSQFTVNASGDVGTSGTIATSNTTASTSSTTGALKSGGGIGAAGAIWGGTYIAVTGTTLPTQAAGTLGIGGIAAVPTLAANGEGDLFLTTADGLNQIGKGSSFDLALRNSAGTIVSTILTGTTTFATNGNVTVHDGTGTNLIVGFTARHSNNSLTGTYLLNQSAGAAAGTQINIGNNTSATKAQLVLNGSGNSTGNGAESLTLKSASGIWIQSAGANGIAIGTSGAVSILGVALPTQTAGTLGLAGITTAPTLGANGEGDFFLTTAGGLNRIGQGSTSDHTWLNKSGATVISIPTGTTNLQAAGSILELFEYSAPTTGATVTMAANTRRQILEPAGTLATLTVVLPPSPVDGQVVGVGTSQIITTLTVNSGTGGATVVAAPTTLALGSVFSMLYRSTGNKWFPTA